MARLSVIGAGAWGTTIAQLLAGNGHEVTLWTRSPEHAAELSRSQRNDRRLPGTKLHPNLQFSSDPQASTLDIEAAFVAVPSKHVAGTSTLSRNTSFVRSSPYVVPNGALGLFCTVHSGRTVNPGVSIGTSKIDRPRLRVELGSVRTIR